jgi:hypothetical protein
MPTDCGSHSETATGGSRFHRFCGTGMPSMKALVYLAKGKKALDERPKPDIAAPNRQNDDLRHRSAYSQRRRSDLPAAAHPGP